MKVMKAKAAAAPEMKAMNANAAAAFVLACWSCAKQDSAAKHTMLP